jgi:hypothetical protein
VSANDSGVKDRWGALDFFLVKCAKGRASFDEVRRWTSPPQKLPESVINHVEEIGRRTLIIFRIFFFKFPKSTRIFLEKLWKYKTKTKNKSDVTF